MSRIERKARVVSRYGERASRVVRRRDAVGAGARMEARGSAEWTASAEFYWATTGKSPPFVSRGDGASQHDARRQ